MRPLQDSELVDLWERARMRPAVERPVVLLAAAERDVASAEGERLPLGRRDALLLALRRQTFGGELNCLADCPKCHSRVEFTVPATELELPAPNVTEPLLLTRDGLTISFRLPDTADLAAAATEQTPAAARCRLFAQCLLSATRGDGEAVAASEVPDDVVHAAGACMAEADPQADVTFALHCPQCAGVWEAPFDAAGFFWQELDAWAGRLLREVHELASAYGWSEAQVFALSSARRHAYLELIHR